MCCINNNGKPERDQGFKTWTYYVCVWSVECGKLRATIFLSRFSQTKWNAVRLMCLGCILDLYPYSKLRVNWIYCAHTDHLLGVHTLDPIASRMHEIHCPYATGQIWPCAMEVSANGLDLLFRWLNLSFSWTKYLGRKKCSWKKSDAVLGKLHKVEISFNVLYGIFRKISEDIISIRISFKKNGVQRYWKFYCPEGPRSEIRKICHCPILFTKGQKKVLLFKRGRSSLKH